MFKNVYISGLIKVENKANVKEKETLTCHLVEYILWQLGIISAQTIRQVIDRLQKRLHLSCKKQHTKHANNDVI